MVGREGLLITALAATVAAAGCTPKAAPGGWAYQDANDPITSQRQVTATRSFTSADGTVQSDVMLSCAPSVSPQQLGLKLELTTYDKAAQKGGRLPPAPLGQGAVEYQLDQLGPGQGIPAVDAPSRYTNVVTFNVAYLIAASPTVAARLQKAMPEGTNVGAAAMAAGMLLNGRPDPEGEVTREVMPELRTATDGFAWPYQKAVLRYDATTTAGATTVTTTVPLQDAPVLKVVKACGWGGAAPTNTQATAPVQPQLPATPPASGPSFGVIPVDEKGPEYRVLSLAGVDSAAAKLTATPTRPEAEEYCHRDPGGEDLPLGQCVAGVLKDAATPKTATADCTTGRFTDTDGGRWQFGGRNRFKEHPIGENGQEDADAEPPECLFRGPEGLVGTTGADDYDAKLALMRALCPASVRKP